MLAALTLICGWLSVTTRQIFRAAIYLLFSLIGIAGIYFWMNYQFIAAVQIVVYVGGIVVLIIFSIFLTQQTGEKLPKQKLGRKIFSTLAVFCGFAFTMLQIYQHDGIVQTFERKFSCRDCEEITQPRPPSTARRGASPVTNRPAMILFEKFGQHQPLNRQSERYAREGIDLSVSTLADQVGACALLLQPLHALIEAHVLGAERLHGDDTTVPILAKVKTITGRIWTYVRDDRPFGGRSPPAALYYASCDRRKEHPERHLRGFTGILQADAYSGYNGLYDPSRLPGVITPALCWSHARRQFFELADIAANARRGKKAPAISPVALEAVNAMATPSCARSIENSRRPFMVLAQRGGPCRRVAASICAPCALPTGIHETAYLDHCRRVRTCNGG